MSRRVYRLLLLVISPIWICGVLFVLMTQFGYASPIAFSLIAVLAIALGLLPVFLAWRFQEDASESVAVLSKTLLIVVGGVVGGFVLLVLAVMIFLPGA